jgi:hypothetical protein
MPAQLRYGGIDLLFLGRHARRHHSSLADRQRTEGIFRVEGGTDRLADCVRLRKGAIHEVIPDMLLSAYRRGRSGTMLRENKRDQEMPEMGDRTSGLLLQNFESERLSL